MDLVPIVNGLGEEAASLGKQVGEHWVSWLLFTAFVVAVFAFVRRVWKRAVGSVEDTIFSNWRLALLGATGIVLSIASGWTTWDGMRNFTNEPTLSLMITFGIQGVMLIVAWLIGESFASGMHQRGPTRSMQWTQALGGAVAAIALIALVIALVTIGRMPLSTDQMLFAGVGLALVCLVGFLQWDLVQPYLQSSRIVLRNAVLWVMFLSCMATSVFFSFDSLFSAIFPSEERARAAQLRAQNQVAGIVADIGQTISTRQNAEAQELFSRPGWKKYEEQLDELTRASQGAQTAIEAYFVEQMEARRKSIALQQERIATAESSSAGLNTKKIRLSEELSRLKAERPEAAGQVLQQKEVVSGIEKRLDEQRALTLAEERGVEGSGKVGRGKFWRESKAQEQRIASELEVARKRLSSPQSRLRSIDKRVADIKVELAQIDGELAKATGEAQTAQQRIAAAEQDVGDNEDTPRVDPARVLPAFETAKAAFRQEPTAERLANLHQQCTQLVNAMSSAPATKEKVRSIDCDPKQASEAAALIFALNEGAQRFAANCAGGSKLDQQSTTDALFGFARRCLADAGLPSAQTDQLRTMINHAELNRDDRAHRFVVTWNAFQDGNRLAYLALGIAIAIDALVFMSGLFGANAVRSPLQDVPSSRARSASQLEAIIENALLPDKFDNAHAVLEAMQPITPVDGFAQEVIVPYHETPNRARVLKVLNAGAAIDAVAQDPNRPERYFVRPELFEYLATVAKRYFEADKSNATLAELKHVITVSLQPHVGDHADLVLNHMHPINERHGFSSEVLLSDVPEDEKPVVRKVLNAGATLNYIQQDETSDDLQRYYVHKDLYKTIAMLSAVSPKMGPGHRQLAGPAGSGSQYGGDLTARPPHLPAGAHTQITDGREHKDTEAGGSANEQNNAQLKLAFLRRLLASLGFENDDVLSVLREDNAVEAANDAWHALKAHAQNNERLAQFLGQFEREQDQSLRAVYAKLKVEQDGDQAAIDMLDDTASDIHAAWSTLMLHPAAGLIQSLITQLEVAAEADSGVKQNEQELHDRLSNVLSELKNRDLAREEPWRRVEDVLLQHRAQGTEEDVPNILRLHPKSNGTNN